MSQKNNNGSILFFNKSTFRVAKCIFDSPNRVFHLRLLERETTLSTTAVKEAVDLLLKYAIIKMEKTEITDNIQANLESESYSFYKRVFNIYRLESYLFKQGLIKIFNYPETIVLFGSFAKGEDIEESDIDLLVITSNKPKDNLNKFRETLEKEMNRKVNIHVLVSLDNSATEFKNTIANGIVLYGYLKVI